MFFKKHLLAILVVLASIMACASVLYLVKVEIINSHKVAQEALEASGDLAYQAQVRMAAEQSNEEKARAYEDCRNNIEERIQNIKTIKLPNDLLKNAIWTADSNGSANFTYDGKAGTISFYDYGMGSRIASILYDEKNILVSTVLTYYDGGTTHFVPVKDILQQSYCELASGDINYPIDYNDLIVDYNLVTPDESYDTAPKEIVGPSKQQKAVWVQTVMPFLFNKEAAKKDIYVQGSLKLVSVTNEGWASGYYVFLDNGRFARYETNLSMYASTITLNGRKQALSAFEPYREGGCASSKYFNMVNIDKNDLNEIGMASNGDKLYAYKSVEKVRPYYQSIYFPDSATNENISFEKFVAAQPYFIWFDGFGSAIEYRATKYTPAAECGKPVIYLYPEKDMNVSVKVEPNGGFKLTEPAYNNGWNVWATTKSELTNLSDGSKYPYLFWEGHAYNYATPDEGFVLKRENVGRDMEILLARLGLNEKESADFMEFWQSKLEAKPFVYVTFLAQTEFDKLSPLTVSPKPDKIIRVFMDYTPLDQFMYVAPLKITTPERTGFTVVEWGGRLR